MLIHKWFKRSGALFLVVCLMMAAIPFSLSFAEDDPDKTVTINPSESLEVQLSKLEKVLPNKKCWNVDGDPVKITFGGTTLTTYVNNVPTCDHSDKDFSVTRCEGFGFKSGKPFCGGKGSKGVKLSFQCSGYARMLGWAVSGNDPWGKKGKALTDKNGQDRRNAVEELVPGDIIIIGDNTDRHTAFITAVNSKKITVTELNTGDNRCRIYWGKTYEKKDLRGDGKARNKLYIVMKYNDYSGKSNPKSIKISGPESVEKGKTIRLTAAVEPKDASQEVSWSTGDKKIATVNEKGEVTGKKAGTVTITATSKAMSSIKASMKITVTDSLKDGIPIDEKHFPDAAFRKYVKQFDQSGDNYLQKNELSKVTDINVDHMGISDIKGVEYFTALKTLSCEDNKLSKIDISTLKELTSFSVYNNKLKSIDLSHNTKITYLSLGYNQFTSLDVSKNTALTVFGCQNNKLAKIDISKNKKLTWFSCAYNNSIETLNVKENTALRNLYCHSNKISKLELGTKKNLAQLNCADNRLTSINVSGCPILKELAKSGASRKFNEHYYGWWSDEFADGWPVNYIFADSGVKAAY